MDRDTHLYPDAVVIVLLMLLLHLDLLDLPVLFDLFDLLDLLYFMFVFVVFGSLGGNVRLASLLDGLLLPLVREVFDLCLEGAEGSHGVACPVGGTPKEMLSLRSSCVMCA